MIQYKILLIALLLLGTKITMAQPGNNTVKIQGVFTPSLGDVHKIQSIPLLVDTVYQVPEFKYIIEEKKLETPFEITPIRPAKLLGEPLSMLYNNYVAFGMGNYLTPYFEMYHSKLRSRDMKYGVHIKHLSGAGKIKDYAFPAWSSNLAEVYGSKFFSKSILEANVTYKRDVNHFYGFQPASYPDSLLPKDVDIVQRFNLVNANVHLYRYRLRKSEMNYDLKLNYYYWQDFYSTAENSIAFDAQFDWNTEVVRLFDDQRLGFNIDEDFYHNSYDILASSGTNLLAIAPFYAFNYRSLKAKVGIDAQIMSDSNSEMSFYPNIQLKLAAIPNVLFFNFNLTGGKYRNSMRKITDENPFVISEFPLGFTNRKFVLNFGMGTSISKNINADLQVYYDKIENAPLYVSDSNSMYNNQFTALYDAYDRVNLKIEITYQKQEKLRFMLRSNYYIYNMSNELEAWHKPSFDVSFSGNYNIQDKILLRASVVANGAMKAPKWTNGVQTSETIDAWVDVNLGVEYRYRKKIGFFLNLNNLTASRYDRWYNYPAYRFNFMAGMNYIF